MLEKSNIEFKLDKSKIEGVSNLTNDIFPSHFTSIILGKPGSGKTSLLKFILKSEDLLFKKFDFVFIITPSAIEFKSLFLPKHNFTSSLNWLWIYNKINTINKFYSSEYINVLFIFDDMISDLKLSERDGNLAKFIFNRRVNFLYPASNQ